MGWLVAGILYVLGGVLAAERTEAIEAASIGRSTAWWERATIALLWPIFTLVLFVRWL